MEKVPGGHTDPYGSIRVHTDPYGSLSGQCSIFSWTYFGHICKLLSTEYQGQKKFLMTTKIVPVVILCRMHRLSNYGDLFVDDFVDISIFMILGSVDDETHPAFPIPPPQRAQDKKTLGSSLRLVVCARMRPPSFCCCVCFLVEPKH